MACERHARQRGQVRLDFDEAVVAHQILVHDRRARLAVAVIPARPVAVDLRSDVNVARFSDENVFFLSENEFLRRFWSHRPRRGPAVLDASVSPRAMSFFTTNAGSQPGHRADRSRLST